MKTFAKNIISDKTLIKEAIEILNSLSGKDNHTLFVLNDRKQLVGTLSDGDIRRGMLASKTITDNVKEVMQSSFKYLKQNHYTITDIEKIQRLEIALIPVIDEDLKLIDIINLKSKFTFLPVDAIIMAGGEGRRLLPLTEALPKPMLKVGEKPILEHNIDRLNKFGVSNIHISINYLGDTIVHYFKDGAARGLNINYCKEDKPLGTIGSVKLIKLLENDTILVMNSDLLTNIDYKDFYTDFIEKKADMAVATIPYHVSVPYAVLETKDDLVLSLKEKPTYTYYSNAGIYLIKKELFDYIPDDMLYNATDLMEKIISENKKLIYYPLFCYWLDIGNPTDFKKANEDIYHIKF